MKKYFFVCIFLMGLIAFGASASDEKRDMLEMLFHSGMFPDSISSVSQAVTRFVKTSRQTAISMAALIHLGPVVFPNGVFSGDMDGTKI